MNFLKPKETVPEVANDFYDTYLSKPSQRAREVEKQTKEMNRSSIVSTLNLLFYLTLYLLFLLTLNKCFRQTSIISG